MKEKITDLVESIVDEKPVETKDIFEQIMLDKIRKVVSEHEPVVAASLFEDEESEEEDDVEALEYEPEDEDLEEGTVGGMSDWAIVKGMEGKQVVHKGKVYKVARARSAGSEVMNTKGEKSKLDSHKLDLDRGKGSWPLTVDHKDVTLHKGK